MFSTEVLYIDVAHRGTKFSKALLNVLALVIGAVPIALPLVMQAGLRVSAPVSAVGSSRSRRAGGCRAFGDTAWEFCAKERVGKGPLFGGDC